MLQIDKARFIKEIKNIEDQWKKCLEIEYAMSIYDDWYGSKVLMDYIQLFEIALYGQSIEEQNYRYISDFSYFIFELEFGKKWAPGMFQVDGEDIRLSTAAELYDWLVEDGRIDPYES